MDRSWRWVRAGFFSRLGRPHRIQRFQCRDCGRHFSTQTFSTSYWLRRPELLAPVFHRLVGCSGFRQIAREFAVSPQTILGLSARLGRHCLLFHQLHRPQAPGNEELALDSFISFEHSQYYPTAFHLLAGRSSHFCYGFTDSELRRSGRMTPRQRRRRAELERLRGRPHPRATELDVAALLHTVAPTKARIRVVSDEHTDYPRALRRLRHLEIDHTTISSRAARIPQNPLFAINLLDLLVRHSGANHKRETIAYSRRRQSAIERLWLFVVWRNYIKSFSERKRDHSPAMRLKLFDHRLTVGEVLRRRLFPSQVELPERWSPYYWRTVPTRALRRFATHQARYAA